MILRSNVRFNRARLELIFDFDEPFLRMKSNESEKQSEDREDEKIPIKRRGKNARREESFTVFPFDEERKYLTSLSPLALDASRHLGLPFLFFIFI